MKTKIIPAQITTVEDKIYANLNITQITLIILPIIVTCLIYIVITPYMKLTILKMPFIIFSFIIFLTLSLRIKGKIVLNWLIIILKFNMRPKYYVFDKNDSKTRDIFIPIQTKKAKTNFNFKFKKLKKENKKINKNFTIQDLISFEKMQTNKNYNLSFKAKKKGGINVSFEQIQK